MEVMLYRLVEPVGGAQRVAEIGMQRRIVRLARERQTFSGIVDTIRCELAERYLKDRDRSLAEVSSLLGFAAPSGFSRWYRRHFSGRASDVHARSAKGTR